MSESNTSTTTTAASAASTATSAVQTEVSDGVSFFVKNPLATAIGSAIAGALLMFGAMHFVF